MLKKHNLNRDINLISAYLILIKSVAKYSAEHINDILKRWNFWFYVKKKKQSQ